MIHTIKRLGLVYARLRYVQGLVSICSSIFTIHLSLQFALKVSGLIPLNDCIRVWVWIYSESVQRVQLTCAIEHVLIHLAIESAKGAI